MGGDSGKGSAPKGPDWKKLFKTLKPMIAQNQELFREALDFGKTQFTKGDEFSKAIEKYGMDGAGKLGDAANNYKAMFEKGLAGFTGQVDKFGRAIGDVYKSDKKFAGDITDELMPGIEDLSRTGRAATGVYERAGIPYGEEYAARLAGWDTPERREAEAASAVSDISMASEAARESELRRLEGFGIDPSQTRSAALDSRIQAMNAVAKASGANLARKEVADKGIEYGGVANQVYERMAGIGQGMSGAAAGQGAIAQGISMAPGAQYLQGLGTQAQLYGTAAQLGQVGGAAGFDMQRAAKMFGMAGLTSAAGQGNVASQYGSGVYSQGADINRGTAGIIEGAYGTAGQLNVNDQAAWQAQQAASPWNQLAGLAGVALPAAMGSPWLGAAMFGKDKVPVAAARGGAIPESFSPSGGAVEDDVPAKLTAGEYVMDPDTVRWYGEKHFADLQKKARKEREDGGIPAPKQQMASLSRPRPNRAPAMPPGARAAGGIPMTRA